MSEIVIIGAGLTGLATAYHLKKPYIILEKNPGPGGLCSSINADGFTFDHAGHFLHLRDPGVRRLMRGLLGSRLKEVKRDAAVISHGKTVPYPFQANLYFLPENIRRACLRGFIERPGRMPSPDSPDFYRWSLATFGAGITRYFMKPYNEKLWTVSSRRLRADWVAPFVPQPALKEVEDGACGPKLRDFGYNVHFLYPGQGGCQAVIDAVASRVQNLKYNEASEEIDHRGKCVTTSQGKRYYFEHLVSTQPLPELLRQMPGLPGEVKAAAERLDWNSVSCINLAVKAPPGPEARGRHWLYFPEKKYVFYRAGIYTNVMASMAPRGYSSLYAEISRRPGRPLRAKSALEKTVKGLQDAGVILRGSQPEVVRLLDMPFAYVIYDRHRAAALSVIRGFLKKNSISSIGRYGGWEYSFMERSLLEGRKTAEDLSGKAGRRAGGRNA
ncbi:MAG: protoporphyrinogen/coproporphyrinogen oxidase [Endomicrobiales bacterium]